MTAPLGVVDHVRARAFRFPTKQPEADGTLSWDATTAVVVDVGAAGRRGLGWSYTAAAAADIVDDQLAPCLLGRSPTDIDGAWEAMHRACRNLGTKGLVLQAFSAVDLALWDLKARLLNCSLLTLLGSGRTSVPVYGSGGFTNLDDQGLAEHIDEWMAAGCTAMKIKIGEAFGTRVERDIERVRAAQQLANETTELMVDANGAYQVAQARRVGRVLDDIGVTWFEEPVSSDDTAGLAHLRATLDCDVTAGEYVSDVDDAQRLSPVLDCLQLDVTRCGGYTGWRRCAAIAQAHHLEVSGHCAPALHAPIAAATPHARHVEWFIDHVRLEAQLVEGAPTVREGALQLEETVRGHGMSLAPSAQQFQIQR